MPKGYKATVKGVDLETIRKAPRELHIPKYNFCGSNSLYDLRKSGKYEKAMKAVGKRRVGTKPYFKPKNSLDSACKAHDKVYNNPNASANAVRASDKKLMKKAYQIGNNKKKPIAERLASKTVLKIFKGKLKLEDIGVVKKGMFAEGTKKDKSKLQKGLVKVKKTVGKVIQKFDGKQKNPKKFL